MTCVEDWLVLGSCSVAGFLQRHFGPGSRYSLQDFVTRLLLLSVSDLCHCRKIASILSIEHRALRHCLCHTLAIEIRCLHEYSSLLALWRTTVSLDQSLGPLILTETSNQHWLTRNFYNGMHHVSYLCTSAASEIGQSFVITIELKESEARS